jgi:hypothetical protein
MSSSSSNKMHKGNKHVVFIVCMLRLEEVVVVVGSGELEEQPPK